MTFDEWFDKHYPNNDDPLLRRAKRMMWDEIAAAMDNDKIHGLAAIDVAINLPDDGCNSISRTVAEIWRLRRIEMENTQPTYTNYGWLCPRCGSGNAPSTQTCPCVPAPPIVWTC